MNGTCLLLVEYFAAMTTLNAQVDAGDAEERRAVT
jgi:hypothetical protein